MLVTPEQAAGAQRALDALVAAYPRLGELFAQLDMDHLHPLALLNWLLLPCPDLDEDGIALSPFDWLLRADHPIAPVLAAVP